MATYFYIAEAPVGRGCFAVKFGISDSAPELRIRVHNKHSPFPMRLNLALEWFFTCRNRRIAATLESATKRVVRGHLDPYNVRLALDRADRLVPPSGAMPVIGARCRPSGEWTVHRCALYARAAVASYLTIAMSDLVKSDNRDTDWEKASAWLANKTHQYGVPLGVAGVAIDLALEHEGALWATAT